MYSQDLNELSVHLYALCHTSFESYVTMDCHVKHIFSNIKRNENKKEVKNKTTFSFHRTANVWNLPMNVLYHMISIFERHSLSRVNSLSWAQCHI